MQLSVAHAWPLRQRAMSRRTRTRTWLTYPPYPGTPRWVKVLGIIAMGLVLLLVIIVFTGVGGPHGPGRHMPPGDTGGGTERSSVTEDPTSSGAAADDHETPPP